MFIEETFVEHLPCVNTGLWLEVKGESSKVPVLK